MTMQTLKVGLRVRVPWGLDRSVEGEIVDVWGDPATQVRVRLFLEDDDTVRPTIILLSPAVLDAA